MRQRRRDFVVQLCIALIVVVSSVLGPILLVAISVPSVFASVPTVVVVLFGPWLRRGSPSSLSWSTSRWR
jgi:hypothetical protein